MVINHNMSAMFAQRSQGIQDLNQQKSMEKLSSGMRINRAGDDERDAKNKSERLKPFCRLAQDKAEEDDGRDAEHREHRRADEVHTEGHAPVFD